MKSLKYFKALNLRKTYFIRRVAGNSMLPSLRSGRIIIAKAKPAALRPTNVVIVRHDSIDKVKRIKSLKRGRLFLLGDNADLSLDSRSFGWVSEDQVIGKVIWPRI